MKVETLFDTGMIRQNRLRALARDPARADFLLRVVAGELADRLGVVERRFPRAAALHCHTGQVCRLLAESGKTDEITRVETDPELFFDHAPATGRVVAALDAFPFDRERLQLVVSALSMHLADDLPGLLRQIADSLSPDGLLLAALPGAGTLGELRDSLLSAETELSSGASPRVIPFADVRDCGGLLQRAGFALPVVDSETCTVRYDTMFHLMADLRDMGMANPLAGRSRRPATRALFARAAEIYAERYADDDGRIRASFNIVYLSGWKPDPGQQKPLRPGSAKMSLTDALNDRS